jgi:hypothetical protein
MIRPSVPLFRASKERSSLAVDRPGEAEVRCVIFLGTATPLTGSGRRRAGAGERVLEQCEQAGHVALPGTGGGSAPLRRR